MSLLIVPLVGVVAASFIAGNMACARRCRHAPHEVVVSNKFDIWLRENEQQTRTWLASPQPGRRWCAVEERWCTACPIAGFLVFFPFKMETDAV